MPIDPSIPLQGQQVSPFASMQQTLQPMVSLAQLANARQQNEMMQAETQSLQQNATAGAQKQQEWEGLRGVLADPSSEVHNPDGTVNIDKLSAYANRNMPLSGPAMVSAMTDQLDRINTYKTNLANMGEQDMGRANSLFSSWMRPDGSLTVSPQQMGQQIDAVLPSMTGAGATYITHAKDMIANAALSGNPQVMAQTVAQLARTTTPASTQEQQRRANTSFVNTGAATVPVSNTGDYGMPPGTQTGAGVANQVGPEGRQAVTGNPLTGGMSIINRDANGTITGITNPPTRGVYVPQPGDVQALPALQAERDSARTQYTAAGTQHENNRIVLANIDNVGATGVAGPAWRNIASAFGFNPGDAKDSATAYDMVGKGLERSALQAAQSMGPQTNAGLDAQIKANGSLGYTPQAIKEITKLNDALVTGTQSYQPGLERAIAANPSAGVFAKRQFDQAWGANFDPTIFRYYNAIKSGDTAEQQAIVKQLGGLNSKGYNAMMQKAKNLQQLSNTGSLQ